MQIIKIEVKDPVIEQGNSFHVYTIAGADAKGDFYSRRRFSDFLIAREAIKVQWPGCYIPSLPAKKLVGYKQPKFVEHRRRFLQYFCQKISTIRYLYDSEQFQLLIRHPEQSIERPLKEIPPKSIMTIVRRLEGIFQLQTIPLIDLKQTITKFHQYVGEAIKKLKTIYKETEQLVESKSQFEEALNNCHILLLPSYEKEILTGYLSDSSNQNLLPIHLANKNIGAYQVATNENNLSLLMDFIDLEIRELEVMDGLVEDIRKYQADLDRFQDSRRDHQQQLSKLMSGKSTLKSMFNFSSKEQQIKKLEYSVEAEQAEIDALQKLVEHLYAVVGGTEINKYKVTRYVRQATKRVEYYADINHIAKRELEISICYAGLEKKILQSVQALSNQVDEESSKPGFVKKKSQPATIQIKLDDDVESSHMSPQPQ